MVGESLLNYQLLNVNQFRQCCMKTRPDTPISLYDPKRPCFIHEKWCARGIRTPGLLFRRKAVKNSKCCFWCRLQRERAICLALELDRSWTEMTGVNPYGGTISLDTAYAFTICKSEKRVAACDDLMIASSPTLGHRQRLLEAGRQFRQLKSSSRLELTALLLLERNLKL